MEEQQFSCAFTDLFEVVEDRRPATGGNATETLPQPLTPYFELNR